VASFLDALETPQYARVSNSHSALEGIQVVLPDAGSIPHQDLPRPIHLDDDGPTPNSKEDASQRGPPPDKSRESVLPSGAKRSSNLQLSGNLKMSRTIGSLRFLLFSTFITFTTFLLGLMSYLTLSHMRTQSFEPSAFSPSVSPIPDSSLEAADVIIGTYFSTADAGVPQTKFAHNDGEARICVQTKSGTDWLASHVQCLEEANPRSDTPLTVLDWLGGPR
jgi:hypothetical protein